jgi:hypothetical protein
MFEKGHKREKLLRFAGVEKALSKVCLAFTKNSQSDVDFAATKEEIDRYR